MFELLISYAIPRRDVRPLARGLLKKYGSIPQILTAPVEELVEYPGVGRGVAIFIKLMHRLIMIDCKFKLADAPVFHDERVLSNYCRMNLGGKKVEEFHVFYLDVDWRLISDEMHSRGTVDTSAVYAREILKQALNLNARYVILVHNHPISGKAFSRQDIETTDIIAEELGRYGIILHDHLLVSNGIVYSARNMFLLGKYSMGGDVAGR